MTGFWFSGVGGGAKVTRFRYLWAAEILRAATTMVSILLCSNERLMGQ